MDTQRSDYAEAVERGKKLSREDCIAYCRALDQADINVSSWEADFLHNALHPRAAWRQWTDNQKATVVVMLDEYGGWDWA